MNSKNLPYIDGFIIPVTRDQKQEYLEMAKIAAEVFIELGALEVMEAWGDDVLQGENTDFYKAIKAKEGEEVVLSWIVWPSKKVRNESNAKAMKDERMADFSSHAIFSSSTMIYSGFQSILHQLA